jgi:hypothetical protein
VKRKYVKRKYVKRKGRVSALRVIRANATRACEERNRLGMTWRSRLGTLRERDFETFDRNILAAGRMRRRVERWLFGRPKKPESSLAADFVQKEV